MKNELLLSKSLIKLEKESLIKNKSKEFELGKMNCILYLFDNIRNDEPDKIRKNDFEKYIKDNYDKLKAQNLVKNDFELLKKNIFDKLMENLFKNKDYVNKEEFKSEILAFNSFLDQQKRNLLDENKSNNVYHNKLKKEFINEKTNEYGIMINSNLYVKVNRFKLFIYDNNSKNKNIIKFVYDSFIKTTPELENEKDIENIEYNLYIN